MPHGTLYEKLGYTNHVGIQIKQTILTICHKKQNKHITTRGSHLTLDTSIIHDKIMPHICLKVSQIVPQFLTTTFILKHNAKSVYMHSQLHCKTIKRKWYNRQQLKFKIFILNSL